jgi:hypothetical protein
MLTECGHSICLQCVKDHILSLEEGQEYICPEDKIAYRTTKEANNYPKNIMLLKMMEKVRKGAAVTVQATA